MKNIIIFVFIGFLQCTYGILNSNNCLNSSSILQFPAQNPKMKFFLFTPFNKDNETELFTNNATILDDSNFDPALQTRILIPGWQNNWNTCQNGFIKDAYFKNGNFNVIAIDWNDWGGDTNYAVAIQTIFGIVGQKLAEFTAFLNSDGKAKYDDMYLVGHSLGAHVAGACAAATAVLYPNADKFNTIFGLDPAGFGFVGRPETERLNKNHAIYVEHIATNIPAIGYPDSCGHAAFYVNYGQRQKYCNDYPLDTFCNHHTSYFYFAESIYSQLGFCSVSCDFTVILQGLGCPQPQCAPKILMGGEPSRKDRNGTYYTRSQNKPQFARCDCPY